MGLAAFIWWPNGDYKPIQPGERGTVQDGLEAIEYIPTGRPGLIPEREQELNGAPSLREQPGSPTTPDINESDAAPDEPAPGATPSDEQDEPTPNAEPGDPQSDESLPVEEQIPPGAQKSEPPPGQQPTEEQPPTGEQPGQQQQQPGELQPEAKAREQTAVPKKATVAP